MKRSLSILLTLLLVLGLCACGQSQPAPSPAPEAALEAPEEIPEPEAAPEESPALSPEELFALAESFTDRPVDELIEAIGEPVSRDYVSSCMGSGEDGELRYEGFTVYTYREGDSEIVMGVE